MVVQPGCVRRGRRVTGVNTRYPPFSGRVAASSSGVMAAGISSSSGLSIVVSPPSSLVGEFGDESRESGGVRRQRTGKGSSDVVKDVPNDGAVVVPNGNESGRHDS